MQFRLFCLADFRNSAARQVTSPFQLTGGRFTRPESVRVRRQEENYISPRASEQYGLGRHETVLFKAAAGTTPDDVKIRQVIADSKQGMLFTDFICV